MRLSKLELQMLEESGFGNSYTTGPIRFAVNRNDLPELSRVLARLKVNTFRVEENEQDDFLIMVVV